MASPRLSRMTSDLQYLQGCWKILSLEIDGQTLSAAALGDAKITIQGDKFVSYGMGTAYAGIIELGSTSAPKTFNMKFTDGPETGNTNLGIYELDGNRWRICLATRGAIRPTDFVAIKGNGIAVEILEREV